MRKTESRRTRSRRSGRDVDVDDAGLACGERAEHAPHLRAGGAGARRELDEGRPAAERDTEVRSRQARLVRTGADVHRPKALRAPADEEPDDARHGEQDDHERGRGRRRRNRRRPARS